MPEIYENALKSALSAGKIAPSYILFGDDSFLVSHYEKAIIAKTCGKDNDFDLQRFEIDVDLQAVYDAVNQFPMMGGRKCVILSDYDFEAASKTDFDRLVMLLSNNYEFSTLVLKFDAVSFDSKRSAKAKKLISSAEKGGGCAAALNHRSNAELEKMLINGAKKRDKTMQSNVAKYMVESCGTDINTLSKELEKVCRFVDGGDITKDDIDFACVKSVEASVYEYVKKVIACDTLSAVKILNNLLYMHFEPMIILYTAASAFVDMARMNAAGKANKSTAEVAGDFSYKNKAFVLSNAAFNLKKFSDKKLKLCMRAILAADKLLKSFSYDEGLILEQMTIELIYIIANGESIDKA